MPRRSSASRSSVGVPLFVFSDPFGLGLDSYTFGSKLMRRPEPTDILLNFSLQALRRCAGMLDSKAKADRVLKQRTAIIDRLDAALGGDWWQEVRRAAYASTRSFGMVIEDRSSKTPNRGTRRSSGAGRPSCSTTRGFPVLRLGTMLRGSHAALTTSAPLGLSLVHASPFGCSPWLPPRRTVTLHGDHTKHARARPERAEPRPGNGPSTSCARGRARSGCTDAVPSSRRTAASLRRRKRSRR